jgi:hypothetical protein
LTARVVRCAFVGVLLVFAAAARARAIRWPRALELLPAYVVGSLGAFWSIERSVALAAALQ